MAGGEGGDWCPQDMKLGSEFYQLVSQRPLVAFKILTLLTIVEHGGLPLVRITLSSGATIEGDFDGVSFERGSFKLDIFTTNNENTKVEPVLVSEIAVFDTCSDHINEQSIARTLKINQELDEYFQGSKVGGGGVL